MTGHQDLHEPTPAFRAHLEWQIATALRRESRLTAPVGRHQPWRVAALVFLALMLGGAAGIAAGRIQDARQRSSLTESVNAEMQLMETRLQLAEAEYQDARRRYETGTAGRDTLTAAEQQVREATAALRRLQLDLAEIRLTASSPRNELTAPLVGQRDFVRDRLMLELEKTERALAAAEQRASDLRSRVEIGTASPAALADAQAELLRATAEMRLLQRQLELRKQFLQNALDAEQVMREHRRTELTLRAQLAETELAAAQRRLGDLRSRADLGLAGTLEVKRAEVALLERQIELQRLRRELDVLRARAK
jgi:outer membrane protein TolC